MLPRVLAVLSAIGNITVQRYAVFFVVVLRKGEPQAA